MEELFFTTEFVLPSITLNIVHIAPGEYSFFVSQANSSNMVKEALDFVFLCVRSCVFSIAHDTYVHTLSPGFFGAGEL